MAEMATALLNATQSSQKLKFRIQFWHWSEAGVSEELNSYLASQVEYSLPQSWQANPVSVRSFLCHDSHSFVPIEVCFPDSSIVVLKELCLPAYIFGYIIRRST
jgi:hypothetical protein